MAEALVGDLTPHCGVSKEEKHAREVQAIKDLRAMLGEGSGVGADIEALWHEYEASAPIRAPTAPQASRGPRLRAEMPAAVPARRGRRPEALITENGEHGGGGTEAREPGS